MFMALFWLGCCLTCHSGERGLVGWMGKGLGKHLTPDDALFLPNWACMLAASPLSVSFEYWTAAAA